MMMCNMKMFLKNNYKHTFKKLKNRKKNMLFYYIYDLKFFFRYQKSSQKVCLMCAPTSKLLVSLVIVVDLRKVYWLVDAIMKCF